MKFSGKVWSDHGRTLVTFLVNSEKPRDAAMRNTGTGFVVLSHHSLLQLFLYCTVLMSSAYDSIYLLYLLNYFFKLLIYLLMT